MVFSNASGGQRTRPHTLAKIALATWSVRYERARMTSQFVMPLGLVWLLRRVARGEGLAMIVCHRCPSTAKVLTLMIVPDMIGSGF
jgi:hypothetical protein